MAPPWIILGFCGMTINDHGTMAPCGAPMVQGQTPKGQLELDEIEVEDHPIGREFFW